jgi:hypothetical protein
LNGELKIGLFGVPINYSTPRNGLSARAKMKGEDFPATYYSYCVMNDAVRLGIRPVRRHSRQKNRRWPFQGV